MGKTNKFTVIKKEEEKIVVEEQRKYRNPFLLFLRRNGRLIFTISLIFSIALFLISLSLNLANMKKSSVVKYESNGVVVSFSSSDKLLLNGLPITEEYANKVFNSNYNNIAEGLGVIIKIKEVSFKSGTIIFYSDKTALIKYKDGTYMRVSKVGNDYGISENGTINISATTKKVTGEIKENKELGIIMLYLSDGSVEVTNNKTVFFVRDGNLESNDKEFYTKLSGVSTIIETKENTYKYSDGTIKKGKVIIVDGKEIPIKEEKNIHDGIKIIYYENGYAEVIKNENSIMVKKSEHIVYDDYTFEIIPDEKGQGEEKLNPENVMNLKDIIITNTNTNKVRYRIVLEETEDYSKHNINKRLSNEYIKFNTYANGKLINNNPLTNNIKGMKLEGNLIIKNNTYLLYEDKLESIETVNVKIGMWIDYETITNEYMNSAFIGTIKIYVENVD